MLMLIDYCKLYFNYPGKQGVFLRKQYDALWPLLRPCAHLYRKLFLTRTRLVCVIGSLGKTTTKRALDCVLIKNRRYQSFSNYGSCLAENVMRVRHHDPYEVLEVGIDHPGEMQPMAKMLLPNIVVVTAIKSEHNRSFPTLEDTRKEKENMVRVLDAKGLAILNGDDSNVMDMASVTKAKIKTFGLKDTNDVYATNVKLNWPQGTTFTIHVGNQHLNVCSQLIGDHMVYPYLAAVTVGIVEGIELDEIVKRLNNLTPGTSRMERFLLSNGAWVIDDSFKGAYESYEESLKTLQKIPAKRKFVFIGNIQEPPGKQGPIYKTLGLKISQSANKLFFTGNVFDRIKQGALEGGLDPDCVINAHGRIEEEIINLKNDLREGDVILFKARDTSKFRRLVLFLKGENVCCKTHYCNIKIERCDECPLLKASEEAFQNIYIKRLTGKQQ